MKTIFFSKDKGERLDKFLKEELPEFSRSQWQKVIEKGEVTVNNEKAVVKTRLKTGDQIDVYSEPKEETVTLPKVEINILEKNEHFLIIEKPTGLPIHPDNKYKENTLIQQLIELFPEIKEIEKNSNRPGVVHRLDKDVSGLMVVARTKEMFDHLREEFKGRNIYKEYLALVHDPFTVLEDEIKLSMERDKKTGKMKVKPDNQPGKTAITSYEVIKNFTHFSYLKITIKTGRTHQIRTLMRALDHPIVGDTLYAKKKTKANIELNRPFLHAHKLKFYNLDKEYVEYESSLPQELQLIIDELK